MSEKTIKNSVQQQPKGALLRVGGISGFLYQGDEQTNTIVIYAIGAPRMLDNGKAAEAVPTLAYKTDMFIPDYIGSGRSDGHFTPFNCISTLLKLKTAFQEGCIGINYAAGVKKEIRYDRIIFVGASLGGRWLPLLPKFDSSIIELGLFYPAVDVSKCGTLSLNGHPVPEEKLSDFFNAMRYDGYHHIFRGILSKQWLRHMENGDDLAPIKNLSCLKDAKVFIAHGDADTDINVLRSKEYYVQLSNAFPARADKDILLRVYEGKEHGMETFEPAMADFLEWLRVERR